MGGVVSLKNILCLFLLFSFLSVFPALSLAQPLNLRSFGDLFPYISEERKNSAFSEEGLIRVLKAGESLELIPASGSGIDLHGELARREHNFQTEILAVLPHPSVPFSRLDAFNALGKISNLPNHLFFSHTRQSYVSLFQSATRLESNSRTVPIPDPSPASILPQSETIFLRLQDVNFGNTFYRGEFSSSHYGIIYHLTNFRTIRFLLFPVLREENLSATVYMEPLVEGMLIYVIAGADVSAFVASRIDIPSAIARRAELFLKWVSDGLQALH